MNTGGANRDVSSGDRTHSSVAKAPDVRLTPTAPRGRTMFDLHPSRPSGPVPWRGGVLLATWVAIHAGCAGANGGALAGDAARTQVQQLIGEAVCTTDADCRTIAVGNKACGGPESYLAWSARQTDPQPLAMAAERYASERKAQNRQSGMVSNCAFVTDPGARCETARGGSAGAGASASAAATGVQPGRCALRRGEFGAQVN